MWSMCQFGQTVVCVCEKEKIQGHNARCVDIYIEAYEGMCTHMHIMWFQSLKFDV